MSRVGERLREAYLASDVTCETTRSPEELRLPRARRDEEEPRVE